MTPGAGCALPPRTRPGLLLSDTKSATSCPVMMRRRDGKEFEVAEAVMPWDGRERRRGRSAGQLHADRRRTERAWNAAMRERRGLLDRRDGEERQARVDDMVDQILDERHRAASAVTRRGTVKEP